MDARPVPVPAMCLAACAVMTPDPIGHDDSLPLPLDSLLRRRGTSEAALRRLPAFTHQRVVSREAPCDEIGAVAVAVREEALRLAARHHGVALDVSIPRVIEHGPGESSLAHAAQWFAADFEDVTAESLSLTTSGLVAFGLPEVVWPGVAHDRHAMTSAAVAGLVHRLLHEWPEHDPVGPATVTLRDIAYGLGDPAAGSVSTSRSLILWIDYDRDAGRLAVSTDDDPAVALFA